MAGLAITLLSTMRTAVGAVAFIAPRTTSQLAGHPSPASSALGNRLWASRDAVLGGLLFAAASEDSIRGALYAGIVTDAFDIVSVALGLMDGSVGVRTAVVLGGGGLAFMSLGLVALKGLEGKRAAAPQEASLLRGAK